MNSTIAKFGWPASMVREFEHWVVLLRPAQPTLGSLVLAAKSDVLSFGDIPAKAHAELASVTWAIEGALRRFVRYEKLNYLMLMMVDPHVHFHVIPRYNGTRSWGGVDFADAGWPKVPELGSALALDDKQISALGSELSALF